MKKIGILTYHPYDNYGAILQAYALQTYIDQYLCEDVEIINFRTGDQNRDNDILKLGRKQSLVSLASTLLFRLPIYILLKKRHRKFEQFREHYLRQTKRFASK